MTSFWRAAVIAGLGIFLALVGVFISSTEHAKAPTEAEPARIETTSTVSTTTPVSVATTTAPKPEPKSTLPIAPIAETPAPTAQAPVATTPLGVPQASSTALTLNERVRAAVVNILCITGAGGPFESISGSGVIVDPRGLILTNAHVAQYYLLRNYPSPGFVECTIRTGSPAEPKYKAELVFIPPAWVSKNAQKINQEKPMGNGEHDYAFLRITGTVHPNIEMPAEFPYLQISVDPPALGDQMLIAAYPAGFLDGISIQRDLYQASSLANVGELYTFASSTIDLFSIGGSIVAQQGSSGGATADKYGILNGIIVTSTDAPDTGSRDLRALATRYIVPDFQTQYGLSLSQFLSRNLQAETADFELTVAPSLRAELITAIEHPAP